MNDKDIVRCPCGKQEYYGNMIWKDGVQWCRACTYERWTKESEGRWHPTEEDKVFPD